MYRKFTLPFILIVCALITDKKSFAGTIIDNGTNTNYNLTSADSLVIATGSYTGNINSFPFGAKITVTDMAIFQPGSFPNNAAGAIYNYGTSTLTGSPIRTNTGFKLDNYGVFTVNGATIMNGSNQLWTNNYGAVMTFTASALMNGDLGNNNILSNYGTINANANFQMNSGSLVNNYKNFYVSGNAIINGGTLNNIGRFETVGSISLNSGATAINNYCRMISSGGISISNGNMNNYSYLWARNDLGLGTITVSSGNLVNVPIAGYLPMIHGRSLIHSGGNITGSGYLYFYGSTTKTGAGLTGTSGITTDTLKMNDITRANTTIFYDAQTATVYPNAIYKAWGVPDSTRLYLIGCSLEINLEVPLAINWNYFFVNLVNDIPLLTWSAEFDRSTIFEIQRSYDGTNFYGIKEIPSEVGRSEYLFSDKLVNTQSPIVYYRIKATQLSGEEKYTQVKTVRFNSKQESNLVTAPNPFNNNFIINYQSAQREMITIRVFNVSGQQQLTKQIPVNNGVNIIKITEAAQLPGGIYIIQVSNGNKMISSGKLIKQ